MFWHPPETFVNFALAFLFDRSDQSSATMSCLEPQDFDRVSYRCRNCRKPGLITAVYLSLTRVILEGSCGACGASSLRSFDLLQIDGWLNGERKSPEANESCDLSARGTMHGE